MLKVLEAEGFATIDGARVRFTRVGPRLPLAEERELAMARFPQMAPLFELLDHCAAHFHLALSGENAFPQTGNRTQMASAYCRETNACRSPNIDHTPSGEVTFECASCFLFNLSPRRIRNGS